MEIMAVREDVYKRQGERFASSWGRVPALMDTGIENRSYRFPYLDMRQIGGRYSDVEYLLFV